MTSKNHRLWTLDFAVLPIALFFIFLFACSITHAQDEKEKWGEGEIEKVEIQITKDKQITLPQAARNFEKIPPRAVDLIKPMITYQYKIISSNVPDYSPVIRPLKLKDETISKIYGNYVSAGFGNYSSPYAEAYFANKRDKNKSYGVKFYHRSFSIGPVDEKNSANGNTEFRVFGKRITNDVTLSGYADYESITTHFYGYPSGQSVDKNLIFQRYTIFSLEGELENTKPSDFNYNLKTGYSYLNDYYKANEGVFNLNFSSHYKINDKNKVLLDADYFLMNRNDQSMASKARYIFKIKPAYQFSPIQNLVLTTGINAVIENDTIGKQNKVHLYPHVTADYALSNSLQAYVALTGGIDRVSLHSLQYENTWINSNINLFNTNHTLDFSAGLHGRLSGKVSYGAGLSFANLKNLYFYQADTSKDVKSKNAQNRFNVFYDDKSTQRTSFFGEVNYSSENFKIGLHGNYFAYSTSIANQIAASYGIKNKSFDNVALHRPTYRVAVNSSYNFYDKIVLSADFIVQGGIKALDIKSKTLMELHPAADLNFKINYRVSKQFSVFLDFNNILSSDYQLYANYPVRRSQILGGASWNF